LRLQTPLEKITPISRNEKKPINIALPDDRAIKVRGSISRVLYAFLRGDHSSGTYLTICL